jgi:C1A family cysteine protease
LGIFIFEYIIKINLFVMEPMSYKFNLKKSPIDVRDYMLEAIYPEAVKLPEEWDLRPQMRPIRDQGQQGTCSAQTAAAIKEWEEFVDVKFEAYMSPQFVYNLRENQESDGMTPRDTMNILYKIGIVSEADYPYGTFILIPEELKEKAAQYKIQGYAQINTIDSLKKALFANGACYIAFPVYNPEVMEFWKPEFTGQEMLGGHAVTVSGYLKNSFIIRNSWSTSWGDKGYTYFPFDQWGFQWEVWTAIDADSNPEGLAKKLAEHKRKRRKRIDVK